MSEPDTDIAQAMRKVQHELICPGCRCFVARVLMRVRDRHLLMKCVDCGDVTDTHAVFPADTAKMLAKQGDS